MEFLQNEYEGSKLGFDNVEEWVFNALYELGNPNELWHQIQRDDIGPDRYRYRYTEKYGFGHFHWLEERFVERSAEKAGKKTGPDGESFNSIKKYMAQHSASAGGAVEKYLQSAGWMNLEDNIMKSMEIKIREMQKNV
jgi:hypothetical protein